MTLCCLNPFFEKIENGTYCSACGEKFERIKKSPVIKRKNVIYKKHSHYLDNTGKLIILVKP